MDDFLTFLVSTMERTSRCRSNGPPLHIGKENRPIGGIIHFVEMSGPNIACVHPQGPSTAYTKLEKLAAELIFLSISVGTDEFTVPWLITSIVSIPI